MSNFDKLVYTNAVVVGFVIMAFEMLGSRYLNPYFGSSIYTWAALITVVMIALSIGYFAGGVLADKFPTPVLLGILILIGSMWLGFIPLFNEVALDMVFATVEDIRYASLIGALVILLLPLTLLGIYSPYAIRLILSETGSSGTVSGRIYGVSTIGSVFGTLVTTFYLIPTIGTKMITFSLSALGVVSGLSLIVLGMKNNEKYFKKSMILSKTVFLVYGVLFLFGINGAVAGSLSLEQIKSLPNGMVEHVESEYNDIFISKTGRNAFGGIDKVTMAFRRHGAGYTESIRDLTNEYALPVKYTQVMTVGLAYQPEPTNIIMLGLGGASTTKYIHKYFPDAVIKVVELDNEVINMSKKYFGVEESERYQLVNSDARVYLRKNKSMYDIIMIDAFRGGYIPFHLLTTEFYKLVEQRMTKKSILVINLHGGSKLFDSSVNTLNSVFTNVDTFTSNGMGNVIIVAHNHEMGDFTLNLNAKKLQLEKQFYYDIQKLLKTKKDIKENSIAPIFTDDFAPANVYDSIKTYNSPRW